MIYLKLRQAGVVANHKRRPALRGGLAAGETAAAEEGAAGRSPAAGPAAGPERGLVGGLGVSARTGRGSVGERALCWVGPANTSYRHGQHAIPFVDGAAIEIRVNCKDDAGKLDVAVPYAVAVSVEVGVQSTVDGVQRDQIED
jgi:hypothetical protein